MPNIADKPQILIVDDTPENEDVLLAASGVDIDSSERLPAAMDRLR